jgi:DNA-binding NarL/FixJ family response regulator
VSIRVLVVDDQALIRGSFRLLVDSAPDLVAVGEAATGTEAAAAARRDRPDVVLMDIRMPDGDGIEATRLICGDPAMPGVRVLILTTFDLDEYVYAALRAGASGSCSRTPRQPTCSSGSGWWRRETGCWHPR